MNNPIKIIVFLLLCFPKIKFSENEGILIGEIGLILVLLWKVISVGPIFFRISKQLFWLLIFSFFYICFTNIFLNYELKSLFPFFRIAIYILAINSLVRRKETVEDRLKLFVYANATSQITSILIFIYFFLNVKPLVNDIIWGYDLGLKLIPIYGLGLNTNLGLSVVGGGSGILVSSSSLISTIYVNKSNIKLKNLFILLNLISVVLAQSRGGILVLSLYLVATYFKGNKLNLKAIIFSLLVFTILFRLEIFEIFLDSFVQKLSFLTSPEKLDGSSLGRLENYFNLFDSWSRNISDLLIGYGFESNLIQEKTSNTIVESFLLSIPAYGGLLTSLIFLGYIFSIVNSGKEQKKYLIPFYLWSSAILWSITGGDFFAVTTLTPTILILSKYHEKGHS